MVTGKAGFDTRVKGEGQISDARASPIVRALGESSEGRDSILPHRIVEGQQGVDKRGCDFDEEGGGKREVREEAGGEARGGGGEGEIR